MSYSTLLGFDPKNPTHWSADEELRNSYGSDPYVWLVLMQRVYGDPPPFKFSEEHEVKRTLWDYVENIDKLYQMVNNSKLDRASRAVLAFTFDTSYVDKKNFKQFASDIREFLKLSEGILPDCPNHWTRIENYFDNNPDNLEAIE